MTIWTVQELTAYLKHKLESDLLLSSLLVRGEISNYKRASSGHCYFTLKDQQSCLKTVMFNSYAQQLLFQPENGLAVTIQGYLSLYERDGVYQLYAQQMEPEGLGAWHLALEQLKTRLEAEGLFAQKRPLPKFPARIALVTSPTGAAVQDMVNILNRRWPGLTLTIVPVAVQGEAAPLEIASALQALNQAPEKSDLIILGRGGGSLEELGAFNTEVVARAIFASQIPTISAVGHETDFTLADWAADLRAATPSAAAELAVLVKAEVQEELSDLEQDLLSALQAKLDNFQGRLQQEARQISSALTQTLEKAQRQLDFWQQREQLAGARLGQKAEQRLQLLADKLQILSPLQTLGRGYAVCQKTAEATAIKTATEVALGDRVTITLERGQLDCQVINIS